MGELVNLNRARKARNKAVEKAQAAANRALHGRTKGERRAIDVERERAERQLDQAKRED